MLTKREIYQATGISDSTFLHWRRLGLISAPAGIKKREALFPDDILDKIRFILARQEEGLKLSQIAEEINEREIREQALNLAIFENNEAINKARKVFERNVLSLLGAEAENKNNITCIDLSDTISSCITWSKDSITFAMINTEDYTPVSVHSSRTIKYEELGLLLGGMIKSDCQTKYFPHEIMLYMSMWIYTESQERIERAFEYTSKTVSQIEAMRKLMDGLK